MTTYTIITRASTLAMTQTQQVHNMLMDASPSCDWHIDTVTTPGDQNQTDRLQTIGGKQVFASTLQQALLDHTADLAVHSLKDLSVHPHPTLTLAAYCKREDPRDVLVSPSHSSLSALPTGATIGTASPRRQALLQQQRPDLQVTLCRGNVQTRLKKLTDKHYDAIILAAAGLHRLSLHDHITEYLDPLTFIPAIGQGVIAVECRSTDTTLQKHLHSILNHSPTEQCAIAERAVNQVLGGDCHAAVAAHATLSNNTLTVRAWVGSIHNNMTLSDQVSGVPDNAAVLGQELGHALLNQGARTLLEQGP